MNVRRIAAVISTNFRTRLEIERTLVGEFGFACHIITKFDVDIVPYLENLSRAKLDLIVVDGSGLALNDSGLLQAIERSAALKSTRTLLLSSLMGNAQSVLEQALGGTAPKPAPAQRWGVPLFR